MILAIESSLPEASLALLDRESGEVCWRDGFTSLRAHNAVIFKPLREALDRCGGSLDLIVIGRGPGSYGGVRVGIAVANGLSLALGAPVLGLSSLEAVNSPEDSYAVIGDARRRTFFLAQVTHRELEGDPELVDDEGLIAALSELSAAGCPLFSSDPALVEAHEEVSLAFPSADRLALRAASLDPVAIEALVGQPLEPHYLRAPYITTPKS